MIKIQAKLSTVIDTEKTTVIMLNVETCVQLIQDLVNNLASTGAGRLVLKTSDDKFLIFKLEKN